MKFDVLIVEDDPMVALINQRYVEKVSNFVFKGVAQTVSEAKELLQHQSYDLLLIDIHLKSESGVDLIKWLRTKDNAVDFIIISAENETKTIEMTASFGAVDYILKPFNFDRLKQSLLSYAKKAELLNAHTNFSQADIDKLYWNNMDEHALEDRPLEKGISRNTLKHLLEIVKLFNRPFSVDDITEKSGISHVTIRKYLHYLETNNVLSSEAIYGDIGRPTIFYELKQHI